MVAGRIDRAGPVAEVGNPRARVGHHLRRREPAARVGERRRTGITEPRHGESDESDGEERQCERAAVVGARSVGEFDALAHLDEATHAVPIGRGTSTVQAGPRERAGSTRVNDRVT